MFRYLKLPNTREISRKVVVIMKITIKLVLFNDIIDDIYNIYQKYQKWF